MADDLELLTRWRSGDAAAGNVLFRRYYASVARLFRNKVGDAAEDLVQRTFLACLERTDRFDCPERLRGYLLGIARNELYRHFREGFGPRGRFDPMRTSVHELAPSPSKELSTRTDHDLLFRALQLIPLDLQVALELYYWEGLRGPELADVLDVPEGTVRSRLRIGRERLRQRVRELERGRSLPGSEPDFDSWAASMRECIDPPTRE